MVRLRCGCFALLFLSVFADDGFSLAIRVTRMLSKIKTGQNGSTKRGFLCPNVGVAGKGAGDPG
jgi:hypothetical protein